MSSSKSLGSKLDQCDGDALNIVTLLGASCLEIWLGGSMLHSSGVTNVEGRSSGALCVPSPTSPRWCLSWGWPSLTIYLLSPLGITGGWCVDEESLAGIIDLWRCPKGARCRSRRDFVAQFRSRSFCCSCDVCGGCLWTSQDVAFVRRSFFTVSTIHLVLKLRLLFKYDTSLTCSRKNESLLFGDIFR
jgi:hypothetical protein